MSRYIDADRAIESLFDYCNGKKTIGQCIDDTPTAEVKPIVYCKDCKWWKESDGTYRRGVYAESRCPMNTETVYKGEGYCYMAEPQEGEEEE